MNERIQQQLNDFRKVVSRQQLNVNISASPSEEDSLSKAIRTEKDGKSFMSDLKDAVKKARYQL